jgi:hypothetical protein
VSPHRRWARTTADRIASIVSLLLALVTLLGSVTVVLAADPSATPGTGGDPRSPGEGPGFVGEPLIAIGLVVAIAFGAVLATLAFLRATDRSGR